MIHKTIIITTLIAIAYIQVWNYKSNLRLENELQTINTSINSLEYDSFILDKIELDMLELDNL